MPECPIVEISLGKVRGVEVGKVDGGKNVFLFTSLPFAKPPIGDLRFEPPVSPEPWDGILDATKHSSVPIQNRQTMDGILQYMPRYYDDMNAETFDENCLFLSVYTTNPSKASNLPVLFWLYGGGFFSGGESYYDASVFASLHDVVVVIPNYRVSIFGFFSLGKDSDYPGNMGFHDQIMAMKWTQNHIKAFGGNPEKVTIAGESAGSMSVSCHLISPLSTGLFHQAISHSGTRFFTGFLSNSVEKPLNALLQRLKIKEKDPKLLIKQLKSLPAYKLAEAAKAMMETLAVFFGPMYDGKFIPKPVIEIKEKPARNNVPYIVGCNNTEGHGIMNNNILNDFKTGITKETFDHMLRNFLGISFCPGLPDAGYDAIAKEFEKEKQSEDKLKWSKMYGEVLADLLFFCPTIRAVNHHVANQDKSYMYVMTQRPNYNHNGPEHARKAEFCKCDHGDDVLFTLGLPLAERKLTFDVNFSEDEKQLSKEWMTYIANFATNGDPNIGLPVKVKWPEYDANDREYLSVQQPCSRKRNFAEKNFKFWNEVVEPMRIDPNRASEAKCAIM